LKCQGHFGSSPRLRGTSYLGYVSETTQTLKGFQPKRTINELGSKNMQTQTPYDGLLDLISKLKAAKIHFTLTSIRDEAIMIQATVPGERWEIEVMNTGKFEIEIFKSDGQILGEAAIEQVFNRFAE
jgi:hypothetical protein